MWEREEFRALQGTYPVISLSFANVKENAYEKVRYRICQILRDLYMQNRFLLEGDLLAQNEKEYFDRVLFTSCFRPDSPNSSSAAKTSSSVNPKLSAYFSEVVVTTSRLFRSEKIDSNASQDF